MKYILALLLFTSFAHADECATIERVKISAAVYFKNPQFIEMPKQQTKSFLKSFNKWKRPTNYDGDSSLVIRIDGNPKTIWVLMEKGCATWTFFITTEDFNKLLETL